MELPVLAKRLTSRSRLSQREARIDPAVKDLGRPHQEGQGPQMRPRPRPSLVAQKVLTTFLVANQEMDLIMTAALMGHFMAGRSPVDTMARQVGMGTKIMATSANTQAYGCSEREVARDIF